MTAPHDDEALLSRFRQWLEDFRAEAEEQGPFLPESEGPEIGLYRLVEEFTALRHEVKLQTKSTRNLDEQAETLLSALRQAIEPLRSIGPVEPMVAALRQATEQFRTITLKEEQAAQAAGRVPAEALADLDEALERGRSGVEKARRHAAIETAKTAATALAEFEQNYARMGWFRRRRLRAYHEEIRDFLSRYTHDTSPVLFDALVEGYSLIQSRLHRALEAGQIRRIATVGTPVNPDLMTVIELVDAPDLPAGAVVDELRRGYTWRGRVLRYAEVRAARAHAAPTDGRPNQDQDQTTTTTRTRTTTTRTFFKAFGFAAGSPRPCEPSRRP